MDRDIQKAITAIAVLVALVVVVVYAQAHYEATSFRKLTGRTDVTTWDALWVELRVDCTR